MDKRTCPQCGQPVMEVVEQLLIWPTGKEARLTFDVCLDCLHLACREARWVAELQHMVATG